MDQSDPPAPPQTGTRHHTLLHSNEPPDSSEIPFIQSTSSRIDARLSVLDGEIARLKQFAAERAVLVSYGAQTKAALSPMRRMPNELLIEIFVLTVPSVKSDGPWACTFSMRGSPWVLTHVCSRWRAVAISTPALWSQLVLCFCPFHSQPLAAVEAQIERANGLRIHFGSKSNDDFHKALSEYFGVDEFDREEYNPPFQTEIFQYLTESSTRWEELSLTVTPRLLPLLPLIRDRLPSLRRLWLEWDSEDMDWDLEKKPFDYFQTADSLVHLGVNRDVGRNVGEPYPITILTPPKQLTRYCADASWATHRGILRASPTLIEAYVNIILSDRPNPWPAAGETFDLPQLRCLYISDSKPLSNFHVPVLEQLTLGMGAQRLGTRERHRKVPRGLDRFIANTPTIRKLGFMGGADQFFVRTILKKFPHIEELAIIVVPTWEDSRIDSEGSGDEGGCPPKEVARLFILSLFSSLFIDPRPTLLCPRLSRIRLGFKSSFGMASQDILSACLRTLESRWNASAIPDRALEAATVFIEDGPSPDDETQHRIDSLREDGLELSLLTEDKQVMKTMTSWLCTSEWVEHKVPFRDLDELY